jgi:hypothetical protein
MDTDDDKQILQLDRVAEKYVAFVDILGFSSRVSKDFDMSLETFEHVLHSTGIVGKMSPELEFRIYSDSYLLISDSLAPVIRATQGLLMQTLFNDYLVRGGIAHGKHIDIVEPPHLFMVSEAVVKAATIQKTVKYPCVAVDPDIKLEDEWWHPASRNLDRSLLYFGGLVIVNPCNWAWGASAATRVLQMLDAHPEHREKYAWFLELHEAIFSPVPMVPPRFFAHAT